MISKFAEDFRCIILDRCKGLLFGGNFYLGLLKIIEFLIEFIFLKEKALLQIMFFVSFFDVKNQIEPIAIKTHTHKILLMQLNLLLVIGRAENGIEK